MTPAPPGVGLKAIITNMVSNLANKANCVKKSMEIGVKAMIRQDSIRNLNVQANVVLMNALR